MGRIVCSSTHVPRDQMLKLDAELRRMHAAARSQYFNATLLREDACGFVGDAFAGAWRRAERRGSHHHRRWKPRIADAKRRYARFCREARPKVLAWKRTAKDRWSRSKVVRPLVEAAWESIGRPMRVRLEPAMAEVEVAVKLTITSFIQETSKLALAHFERQDERQRALREALDKECERERRLERRLGSHHHHHHREPRSCAAARTRAAPAPAWQARARAFCDRASAHAAPWGDQVAARLPLAAALSVARNGRVGCLALLAGAPAAWLWLVVAARAVVVVVGRARRKRGDA